MPVTPLFFGTPAQFRKWLIAHHKRASELWVGFYKKSSGKRSITWPEAVDEALCVGWIDGLRKTIDRDSYGIRFTPRKPTSNWSAVNIRRVQKLIRQRRMRPAGVTAFKKRSTTKSGIYSYENRRTAMLDSAAKKQFRLHSKAWEFFQARPTWYRRTAIWWVVSAKKAETRQKRLKILIADSARRQSIKPLASSG